MSKSPIERRSFQAEIEVRTAPDGTVGIRGYAAVFDSPAHGEVIRSSAFNRSLAQRDSIVALVNHEGVPIASTKAGTMTVTVDERGLLMDIPSLDMGNPTVQELVSAMSRGDIDQMSFAGYFLDAKPNADNLREVREVKLVDVSVVTTPWYEDTTVALTGGRNAEQALVSMRSLSAEQRLEVLVALGDALDDLVEPAEDESDPIAEMSAPQIVDEPRSFTVAEARALFGPTAA
jgi:HK97 family phage prohead protease